MPAAQLVAQPGIGAVGSTLPQTTTPTQQQGPFIRFARTAFRPGYTLSGAAFGASVDNPLASAPGYLKALWLTFSITGGTGTTTTYQPDAPFNLIQFLQVKDPWGTPIVTLNGYQLARIVNLYSGQAGLLKAADITQLPSWVWTATGTNGNFQFKVCVPLEANKGYGVLSMGNASVLPTMHIQLAALAVVYLVAPTGAPVVNLQVDEEYYDIDPQNPVQPPGNGSTLQWVAAQGNQTVGTNSSTRVALPHSGGYLTTLALEFRDSTGALTDQPFNTNGRIRLYIDGIPQLDMTWWEMIDRMFIQNGGDFARPTGLIVFCFKTAMSQLNLGLLDTFEEVLQTSPGTQIEIEMTPWGAITNSPATVTATYGQIIPAGPIATGLGEV